MDFLDAERVMPMDLHAAAAMLMGVSGESTCSSVGHGSEFRKACLVDVTSEESLEDFRGGCCSSAMGMVDDLCMDWDVIEETEVIDSRRKAEGYSRSGAGLRVSESVSTLRADF